MVTGHGVICSRRYRGCSGHGVSDNRCVLMYNGRDLTVDKITGVRLLCRGFMASRAR